MSIVAELEREGLRLSIEGGAVKVCGRRSAITDEVRAAIREHKGEIVEEIFEREERAALMGAPEDSAGDCWARAVSHPALLLMLDKFASLGVEIVCVQPIREGVT